jgi:hypothetical protein
MLHGREGEMVFVMEGGGREIRELEVGFRC